MNPFIRFVSLLLIMACAPQEKSHFVEFTGESFQKTWSLKDLNPELPADWSPYNYLTMEIKASSTQRFSLNLYDTEGIRRLTIHPFQNAWVRASIPLIHFQKRNVIGHDMAAIGKTPLPGLWIGFTGSVGSISQIDSLGVGMRLPIHSPTLEIRNVTLTMESEDAILSPVPAVDELGQWIADEWEGKAESLEDLKGGDTPERRKAFIYDTYHIFITTVNQAIRKYDPNHLNLGLRFGGNPSNDIIQASTRVGFDVFSLNIYGYSTYKDRLERIDQLTGLPIIIGEFHFGTPGRGLAPGLAQTLNQEERGVAYRYYVENAAAHHSVVGTHWFQWWDQPSTGRYDGENYNIGFVSVTDIPYKELIEAAKATHLRMKDIHSGNVKPSDRKAKVQ